MKDIIAIGGTTRDAFFVVGFPIIKWEESPSGKAMAIPFGEKFGSEEVYFTIGGNAANASVTFARQGLKTGIFTKIGNDVAGEEIMRIWKKERVNTQLVRKSKDLPTSYSVLLLQNGERSIITYHGAIDEFRISDIKKSQLKSRWWYVSLPGDSYRALSPLLSFARKNRIKVALNPSYNHLVGHGRGQLLKHLKDVSLLVVNAGEASEITGVPFRREKLVFEKLDEIIPGIVAVTAGPKGVTVSDGAYIYKAGSFKNTKKVVDRTGAGDAFGSGFVAGLIHKKEKFIKGSCSPENIEYAIRLASANATSAVESIGATKGTLSLKQFNGAMRFRKLKIDRNKIYSKG